MVVKVALEKVSILGIPFVKITLEGMVRHLVKHIDEKEKCFVVTANPEIALAAYEDSAFYNTIMKADYITADGIGVVKAASWLGTPLPERVTGFDLFISLLKIANEKHYSVYLLGAKDEVLQKAIENINKDYPNVKIVGSHHGYFDWNDTTMEEEIQEKKPDLIFLALGFPRQEKWIAERLHKFEKGVFMGIGGSFDVIAGEVKRAPEVWQKLNLEWLYRLLKQPTRWRRMLALPRFAFTVLSKRDSHKS